MLGATRGQSFLVGNDTPPLGGVGRASSTGYAGGPLRRVAAAAAVEQLLLMGLAPREQVMQAFQVSFNDVHQAANILLSMTNNNNTNTSTNKATTTR